VRHHAASGGLSTDTFKRALVESACGGPDLVLVARCAISRTIAIAIETAETATRVRYAAHDVTVDRPRMIDSFRGPAVTDSGDVVGSR